MKILTSSILFAFCSSGPIRYSTEINASIEPVARTVPHIKQFSRPSRIGDEILGVVSEATTAPNVNNLLDQLSSNLENIFQEILTINNDIITATKRQVDFLVKN